MESKEKDVFNQFIIDIKIIDKRKEEVSEKHPDYPRKFIHDERKLKTMLKNILTCLNLDTIHDIIMMETDDDNIVGVAGLKQSFVSLHTFSKFEQISISIGTKKEITQSDIINCINKVFEENFPYIGFELITTNHYTRCFEDDNEKQC